jgi:UDP-N-acetylglucosamine 2-epimerase
MAIEEVLIKEKPDWVLIYGDTNSSLAGALAAAKLHIRIAHVEAGLRSFNRLMPEEINRVVADQLSHLLFCPSQVAVNNLIMEGITKGVLITGDVMADALQFASMKTLTHSDIMVRLNLQSQSYLLATLHRAENTDDPDRLVNIINALSELAQNEVVVFPLHPRTKKMIESHNSSFLTLNSSLNFIDPVGYFDMITLEKSARMILTDSGGIQKEAYWLKVPCITLRDETEWVETLENGWNKLTGAKSTAITDAVHNFIPPTEHIMLYGDGHAATKCLKALLECN